MAGLRGKSLTMEKAPHSSGAESHIERMEFHDPSHENLFRFCLTLLLHRQGHCRRTEERISH